MCISYNKGEKQINLHFHLTRYERGSFNILKFDDFSFNKICFQHLIMGHLPLMGLLYFLHCSEHLEPRQLLFWLRGGQASPPGEGC
jgi:hypothetical protein